MKVRQPGTFSFRPDIEGLRALAVLLVIAAHFKVPGFSGGFIGVDVFFVISGYLISGLLFNEANTNGRIDFWKFYVKRLLRLLPALLFVFITSVLAGMFFLAPMEQRIQSESATWVPLWASNLYFATSQLDYFGASADKNLFLHTWSLGVEEQFYLIWPSLLLLLMGYWKFQKKKNTSLELAKYLFALFLFSLMLCIMLKDIAPRFSFYGVLTRMWQFSAGALAFLAVNEQSAWRSAFPVLDKQVRFASVYASLAIGLIAGSAILLHEGVSYPGYWALIPTLAAVVLLIIGGVNPCFPIKALFTSYRSQSIGRISYELYLWHWPILIIGTSVLPDVTGTTRIALIMLCFFLAFITATFISNPLRHNQNFLKHPKRVILVSLVFMAIASSTAIYWSKLSEQWAVKDGQLRYLQSKSDVSELYGAGCDDWYFSAQVKPCSADNNEEKKTAILIGDSIGAQWYGALAEGLPKEHWNVIVLTKSACSIVDEKIYYERIQRFYTECEQWRNDALLWVMARSPDLLIIGSAASRAISKEQWIEGSMRIFAKMAPIAKQIVVIGPSPQLPFDGPECLSRQQWMPRVFRMDKACQVPLDDNNYSLDVRTWLSQAAKPYPNVAVIDIDNIACPNKICAAMHNDQIVFRDAQHLSNSYVKANSAKFIELLKIKYE
jgi:peptidoglycan/LPS O-acetylase OafA/YrhL